ncbi:MAG: hypothetical protein ACYCT9_12160 [Leptospirillum sp.]
MLPSIRSMTSCSPFIRAMRVLSGCAASLMAPELKLLVVSQLPHAHSEGFLSLDRFHRYFGLEFRCMTDSLVLR